MTLKTFMVRTLVFLSVVAASGAANAVPLGTCGSSGANLLSDFVSTTGSPPFTSNGNSCTANDKTFSNFTYFPQGDFAPGVGANPVPPAAAGVASADPTTNCPTNQTCPGLSFTANFSAPTSIGDAFISFLVTAPTASIIDAEGSLSGAAGSHVSDTAILTNGTTGAPLGEVFLTALNPTGSTTFPGIPPVGVTSVFATDDLIVPQGQAATDIVKQFSQTVPAPLIGHGLLVLLAVGGVLCGGKLLENLKKRRSFTPHAAA
jgi:hypothetical protein